MLINKKLKIQNEYFSNFDLQKIVYNYLIKMFERSSNDFKLT